MGKIYKKWILISLGIGFIPVLMLGASPGGIALSPFIIVFSVIVGLSGAAIHSIIFSFKSGSTKQQKRSLLVGVFTSLIVAWLIYSSNSCNLTREYAVKRITDHINSRGELSIEYLSEPIFSEDKCSYSFKYEKEDEEYDFIISSYGKIHIWNYQDQ